MGEDRHEIAVISETVTHARDRVTIHIACSTPGCVYGKVVGSPSAQIRRLVEHLIDRHREERGQTGE